MKIVYFLTGTEVPKFIFHETNTVLAQPIIKLCMHPWGNSRYTIMIHI